MNFVKNFIVDKVEEKVHLDLDQDGDIGGVPVAQAQQQHQQHQQQQAHHAPASYSAAAAQGGAGHAPAQQHAAPHAHHAPHAHQAGRTDMRPSAEELADTAAACSALWALDGNRLQPGRDYELDLQGSKHSSYHQHDVARGSLFRHVDQGALDRVPTIRTFLALLDNYERSTGVSETLTNEEKAENHSFLDAALATPCMQYTHRYLAAKGKVGDSEAEFKDFLYRTWFHMYRRETYRDSSGFEHVFVGEEKAGKVTGFHNWLQFYREERAGKVDYKGYLIPPRSGRKPDDDLDGDEHLLSVQFAWGDETKPVTTMFLGTDPAFEMALYTLCFAMGQQETHVYLGGYDLVITAHRIAGDKIGTCFPKIGK